VKDQDDRGLRRRVVGDPARVLEDEIALVEATPNQAGTRWRGRLVRGEPPALEELSVLQTLARGHGQLERGAVVDAVRQPRRARADARISW